MGSLVYEHITLNLRKNVIYWQFLVRFLWLNIYCFSLSLLIVCNCYKLHVQVKKQDQYPTSNRCVKLRLWVV